MFEIVPVRERVEDHETGNVPCCQLPGANRTGILEFEISLPELVRNGFVVVQRIGVVAVGGGEETA